jgi:hypothetical protein
MSNPKESKLEGINLKIYIIYINLSLVLNLLNKGYYSLALTKLMYLLENAILINSASFEIIESIQNILVDMIDYDPSASLDYFIKFYKQNENSICETKEKKENSFNYLVKLIKAKVYSLSQNQTFMKSADLNSDEIIKNNFFYKMNIEFIQKFSPLKSLDFESNISQIKVDILSLKNFIKMAKQHKLFKLYFNAKLNLAKVYASENNNKAKLIIMKLKDKNLDDSLLLKYYLFECFLNSKNKNFKKVKEILSLIETKFLLKNSGSIEDDYEFYFYKMHSLLYKLKKHLSKFFYLKEMFNIWIYL